MPDYIPLTFNFEALYPPMTFVNSTLRDLYMRLADPCRFTEFKQLGDNKGAMLAEGNNRSLTLAPDRLIYQDDYTRNMFSTFEEDINRILSTLREVCHIPVLLHTKVTIRLLMPHLSTENTAAYFRSNLFATSAEHFSHFKRPMSGAGLRFVFPPTQELRSSYHVRIEPYIRDAKMFFLENSAQFFDPLTDFSNSRVYINEAYNFLKEQAGPFLIDLGGTESQ